VFPTGDTPVRRAIAKGGQRIGQVLAAALQRAREQEAEKKEMEAREGSREAKIEQARRRQMEARAKELRGALEAAARVGDMDDEGAIAKKKQLQRGLVELAGQPVEVQLSAMEDYRRGFYGEPAVAGAETPEPEPKPKPEPKPEPKPKIDLIDQKQEQEANAATGLFQPKTEQLSYGDQFRENIKKNFGWKDLISPILATYSWAKSIPTSSPALDVYRDPETGSLKPMPPGALFAPVSPPAGAGALDRMQGLGLRDLWRETQGPEAEAVRSFSNAAMR